LSSGLDVGTGAPLNAIDWFASLRCPRCGGNLERVAEELRCTNCGQRYPVVSGVPILIDDRASAFRIEDFVQRRPTFFHTSRTVSLLRRVVPDPSLNTKSVPNLQRLAQLLRERGDRPLVLVIGGSFLGKGMEALFNGGFEVVESDVSFGPRTQLVCDAHSIPFEGSTFDAVVAQAVLEHVADPFRCVQEIHRVLKSDGLVYAETPFMQQVHGGAYDFLRFTHLGHRRLFRQFDEISSGAIGGPATVLGWSWEYLLRAVFPRSLKNLSKAVARLTAWPLLQMDRWMTEKPEAMDAASGYYFLGRRSDKTLSDRELVGLYRGAS
jgi:SAM-dependent methyltransferase